MQSPFEEKVEITYKRVFGATGVYNSNTPSFTLVFVLLDTSDVSL